MAPGLIKTVPLAACNVKLEAHWHEQNIKGPSSSREYRKIVLFHEFFIADIAALLAVHNKEARTRQAFLALAPSTKRSMIATYNTFSFAGEPHPGQGCVWKAGSTVQPAH